MTKRIQLKYPKKVFPDKITKICDHDWNNLIIDKKDYLQTKEIQAIQRSRDRTRVRSRTGQGFEMLAVRDNKGIKLIDLNDND
jgi:hypothetical protein